MLATGLPPDQLRARELAASAARATARLGIAELGRSGEQLAAAASVPVTAQAAKGIMGRRVLDEYATAIARFLR